MISSLISRQINETTESRASSPDITCSIRFFKTWKGQTVSYYSGAFCILEEVFNRNILEMFGSLSDAFRKPRTRPVKWGCLVSLISTLFFPLA